MRLRFINCLVIGLRVGRLIWNRFACSLLCSVVQKCKQFRISCGQAVFMHDVFESERSERRPSDRLYERKHVVKKPLKQILHVFSAVRSFGVRMCCVCELRLEYSQQAADSMISIIGMCSRTYLPM